MTHEQKDKFNKEIEVIKNFTTELYSDWAENSIDSFKTRLDQAEGKICEV